MSKKTLEIQLTGMAAGGEALGAAEGKKVFVPWGVPGDLVRVELTEEKKDFARGRILELLKKSPDRASPPCPYFFKCGGCQWQHLKYEAQLRFKNEILKEALQRIGKIADPYLKDPIPAPSPLHYRNRIRLQVSRQGEVGFFKAQSKEVVDIERCLIAEDILSEKIPEAKSLAKTLLEKDRAKRHEVEIKRDLGRVLVTPDPQEDAAFVQVNEAVSTRLVQEAVAALELRGNEKVLELYAGNGNFTFPIASGGAGSVTAVETNEAAVKEGERRVKAEHRKNVRFIQASAYRFLETEAPPKIAEEPIYGNVLLDPPRKGALECLEGIVRMKIPMIVYVSCDPATLARDVKILMDRGYRFDFSQAIDMFPQTSHVESITRLWLPF